MKTVLATVFALVLFPHLSAAQDGSSLSRVELRGSLGWIGIVDDSTLHHRLGGVSARVSLVGGLGIEPELLYLAGPGADRDVTFIPLVSWEFGKGRVKPYVIGGAGGIWQRRSAYWDSEFLVSGGFGVRAQISPRWSVSPEFRMGWLPHLQAKVAVGYRF